MKMYTLKGRPFSEGFLHPEKQTESHNNGNKHGCLTHLYSTGVQRHDEVM